jgi:hypothetical protein
LRELTPAQHASIRRQLVFIPVYCWLAYSWTHLLVRIPRLEPVRDFAHFYVQGIVARDVNTHALYDANEQAAILKRVIPTARIRFPTVYGPQVAIFFRPLAYVSYLTALVIWLVVSLLAYAACCYALWRISPRLHDRPWTILLLLVAAPALHFALGFSQVSAIGLVCLTCGFLALRADRRFLAGLAIGSLAYKPPLGLAVAFVFIFAREWRIVAGAATAAAVQLGIGALYWGPSILVTYAQAVRRLPGLAAEMEPFTFHIHSWRSFFLLLRLPPTAALAAYVIASIVTCIVALQCWRARGPLVLRYSVLLLATILVDPHMYAYDLIMLTPAYLLLWDWVLSEPDRPVADVFPGLNVTAFGGRSFRGMFQLLLYLCYFTPAFAIFAVALRVQLSVLTMVVLVAVLSGLLLSASRQPDPRSVPA